MPTIPAPTFDANREEWPDADFDIPEGQALHSISDKDDDEDWDLEMDLGKTGSAKIQVPSSSAVVSDLVPSTMTQMVTIRPPQSYLQSYSSDDDDDEGVSTIKAATIMPKPPQPKIHQEPIDEDFEDGFSLPSDLTRLSLAPLSLNHRSSKNSLEWGDKDQTSSSQSSDAYSSLGFADASPSSNSTSSASLPDTDEDDDDEDLFDGLVIPNEIFASGRGGSKLNKILEQKKMTLFGADQVKVASPDPEDDFEMGLVIDDDVDLSPSRLLTSTLQQKAQSAQRSSSLPTQRPSSSLRPPSRLKSDRAKSPVNPPPSSTRQFQKLRLSPSPPLLHPTRSQTFQALSQTPPPSSATFLVPKPGSLRGQKSHSGLKPPTPPPTRKLSRKASLSSLMETSQSQASGSGSTSKARYEEPTAASRAKTQRSATATSRYKVPPTRPSTPSSNTAALRLTMPTVPTRARPALASVWGAQPQSPAVPSPVRRNASSPIPRPPSSLSLRSARTPLPNSPPAPKVLRKPRRARTFGDGTELDNIDDLPTDRDKESRFRVQPKGYGNRIPGGTYSSSKPPDKGTIRRKKREVSGDSLGSSSSSIRKASRSDLTSLKASFGSPPKKKKVASPANTRKKPTLIRNLGGTQGPKVVGEMKWNPQTLRWEGNEQALREFDAVVTSTRPALITHLTGSSIGSPVGSFASGARIVGNMIFDPQRMCWISTLPPDEDEPDVFANLADDEEDGEGWEAKGATIRGSLKTPSETSRTSTSMSELNDPPSPARSRTRSPSESDGDSDRGSRASLTYDIDAAFAQSCRAAEQRHHTELSGWKDILSRQDPGRADLYEIRALATRRYQ